MKPRGGSSQLDDEADGGMFSFNMDINDMEREAFGHEEGGRQQEKLADSDFFNKFADDVFDEDDMAS
jgi:hypothetical protein